MYNVDVVLSMHYRLAVNAKTSRKQYNDCRKCSEWLQCQESQLWQMMKKGGRLESRIMTHCHRAEWCILI